MQRWQYPIFNRTLDQIWKRCQCLTFLKQVVFDCGFCFRVACAFLLQEDILELFELNTLNLKKRQYLLHYWSWKQRFNLTVLTNLNTFGNPVFIFWGIWMKFCKWASFVFVLSKIKKWKKNIFSHFFPLFPNFFIL